MFLAHLRDYHGITGPDDIQLSCGWVACSMHMNKERIYRHVMEMHLRICPFCDEAFSQKHTLHAHVR